MLPSTSRSQDIPEDDFYKKFENLAIGSAKSSNKPSAANDDETEVKLNLQLIREITTINPKKIFTLTEVSSIESFHIRSLITNSSIEVHKISKIDCPFLEKAYELKKLEKKLYSEDVNEKQLFHGTKRANIDSICKFNFNWRLHGTGTGHRFGKGVSFSPNAMYASNYSDKIMFSKVMFLAKVLVGRTCSGGPNMTVPHSGCDAATKDDGIVVVKFDDNEYYPAYLIEYRMRPKSKVNRYYGKNNDDYDSDLYDHFFYDD